MASLSLIMTVGKRVSRDISRAVLLDGGISGERVRSCTD